MSIHLFSAEVGGYFAPVVGVPLADFGSVAVVLQPCFGTSDEVPDVVGLGRERQFGAAFFVFHPVDGNLRVAVDDLVEVVLFKVGEAVNYGKKLADIVSAHGQLVVEQLLAGGHVNALVLHYAGVPAAGGIHCQAVEFGAGYVTLADYRHAVLIYVYHT